VSDELPFTGERFTPECVREIWYEHWHRYAFALPLARGRRVLDVACGEGYGADLLATVAAEVTGIDVSAEAVAHARSRYGGRANLRYECADALRLPIADASIDLVVSFETLEHLREHEELLAGFRRVLRPGGVLLISSPDKRTYSDLPGFHNEHHLRELYRDEFEALLGRHFAHRRLYGQKLAFASLLWSLEAEPRVARPQTAVQGQPPVAGLGLDPLYFIAACSNAADGLPADLEDSLSLFTDREESVYAHYNHEVRKNMAGGARILELEAQVAALTTERDHWQQLAAGRAIDEPHAATRTRPDVGAANHTAPLLSLRRWFSRR
jgi:ubiquinone/menaquinone biosynthesis C-methylase UbiE